MRLAWFRAASSDTAPPGAWATSLPALARRLDLHVVTESTAHDFLVQHMRQPYDLCVYEPRNNLDSAYLWAYLFRFPGVLLLQDRSLHDSRIALLERHRRSRDYEVECAFNHGHPSRGRAGSYPRGRWPMLRAAVLGSRLTVVPHEGWRQTLLDTWPDLAIDTVGGSSPDTAAPVSTDGPPHQGISVAVRTHHASLVRQTVDRTTTATAPIHLVDANDTAAVDAEADVHVLLSSLYDEEPIAPLLAALATGRPVVAYEREALAHIPALDPQTWLPRPGALTPPALVTIDPRDTGHSLAVALQRLASEPRLRQALGNAARQWWAAHAAPERVAAALSDAFTRAMSLTPLPRPDDWPPHLVPHVGVEFETPPSPR